MRALGTPADASSVELEVSVTVLWILHLLFFVQDFGQRHQHRLIQRPNNHYLVLEQRLPLERGNTISTFRSKYWTASRAAMTECCPPMIQKLPFIMSSGNLGFKGYIV